jgi:hypothetical protein
MRTPHNQEHVMKMPVTILTAETSPTRSPRMLAVAVGLVVLGTAMLAQAASNCPPGYRQKGTQCIPGPAQPQSHSSPLVEKKIVDPLKQPTPPGPGPLHAAVAGRTTIDPGGKQALNPQPIPPGHSLKPMPHGGAPVEAKGH